MMDFNRKIGLTAFVAGYFALNVIANTYTVSKNGTAQYTTIQAAINKAAPGDTVKIIDTAQYPEQVTIDSTKNGLTLTASDPGSLNKPKIVWQDKVNVHPINYAESQIDSLINYNRNGALRVLGAQNVTILGINVDGGSPFVYGYSAVWNGLNDLLSGNAAVVLWKSGNILIKNCDISNAYHGIRVNDLNEGGIFANANPADIQPQNIVPLSGFSKTGNHIMEYNRIHNNSFGLYFEAAWDLGSTIRYNLIFENHHQTTAFAKQVKSITPMEGANQPGGAMMFYDVAYSPLSIYNNTFWHNFLIFVGAWRTGLQHLVFNNIYAKPNNYWGKDSVFSSAAYMEISTFLPNRMNNCVYSCQGQAPSASFVSIMNNMPSITTPTTGSLISTTAANAAFPATANIRWLEMDSTQFLSVDPAASTFLTPNWNDTLIAKYVKNQGWQQSGVKNIDGSWADLGAIASDGSRLSNLAIIRPLNPISITNTMATMRFSIEQRIGTMQNPIVKLFRFVGNLPVVSSTAWSGVVGNILTSANINDVTLPATPALQVGTNAYTVTIPVAQTTEYGFFEGIIEGKDANGKSYTTSTGLLPYRKLDYKFIVEAWNSALTRKLDTVTVGDTVILKITPQKKDGTIFTNTINPVEVSLASGFTLWNTAVNPLAKLTYQQGITGMTNRTIMFSKAPEGGFEVISVTGIWSISPTDTNKIVFQGSTSVEVLPNPHSNSISKGLGVSQILQKKKQVVVTWFNLLGRAVLEQRIESASGSTNIRDYQYLWKNKLSPSTYIVRFNIQENNEKQIFSTHKILIKP